MTNKKFLKSSLVVMIFIIFGKLFALVRDSLIAAKFGATYITDVYNFGLGIVYLLTTISYGLTTTFIPIHTDHMQTLNKKKSNSFVNNVINLSSIYTILITVVLIIFAKDIIYLFGHGFEKDPKVFEVALRVTRIMLISLIFVSLQSVITGVLQCHKEFYEPAAMSAVSNVVYIIYLVFMASKFGIIGFAVATVIGFFMQFLINVPKYRKLGYRYKPTIDFKDKEIDKMFKLMIPVIISTSVIQLNLFVNRSFATNIFFGAVTVLDCSNKINTLAYEVFAIGISMIVYPSLSEMAVKNDSIGYRKELEKSLIAIMLIMIPASFAIVFLRDQFITIIFKRGAFTNEAAKLTSSALLFYAPSMVAYGLRDILNKAFYSIKDTKTPMVNSFVGIGINVIINIFIVKYMKVSGLALATSISVIVTTILMLVDLNRKLNGINLKKVCIDFLKILIASIIMGLVILTINKLVLSFLSMGVKSSVVCVLISFVFGSLIYAVCIYIFKVDEFFELIDNFKHRSAN
ncbi:murein biosynthesis integral membrane protein MurJ [Clostridium fermenticellae]|uniref:Probable lipid II flippase MurJ n=1 Tax=Clostridium fermenticellae TaxID=2068654 RepID=A0A386H2C2_9CLOT|nr:murein biosynthesis integral membrane protein MurJ [Clostridium fermenticellae]AYD39806.1 murein biosynthesis integral membrane protein MurJ [Clostridium fermenticellae]